MSIPDDTQCDIFETDEPLLLSFEQAIPDILGYAGGIASGAIGPLYASLVQVFGVQMVVADGGRGYEPNLTPFQQLTVALGAGAYDKCVGIAHLVGPNAFAGQIYDFVSQPLCLALYVWDFIVDDDFHFSSSSSKSLITRWQSGCICSRGSVVANTTT